MNSDFTEIDWEFSMEKMREDFVEVLKRMAEDATILEVNRRLEQETELMDKRLWVYIDFDKHIVNAKELPCESCAKCDCLASGLNHEAHCIGVSADFWWDMVDETALCNECYNARRDLVSKLRGKALPTRRRS